MTEAASRPDLIDQVQKLTEEIRALKLRPAGVGTAWRTPTLLNSWAVSGGRTVGYRKLANGLVVVRGAVSGGSSIGAVIFTLPVGFRPSHTRTFVVWTAAGATALDVETDGDVLVTTGGSTAGVFLAPICFFADQ